MALPAQKDALEARAAETGLLGDVLFFHAIRGDMDSFAEWSRRASSAEDVLLQDILASDRDPALAVQAQKRISITSDPSPYSCLVQGLLGQGDFKRALAVAAELVQIDPAQLAPLNLVGKYLAVRGEHAIAAQVFDRSLRLNVNQQDIRTLYEAVTRGEAVEFPLYLRATPRLESVGFYTPAFNVEKYLAHTIESLLLQAYPLDAIYVMNDGSTDATRQIAEQYPVRTISFAENRGLATARNEAFHVGTHAFVGSVDADVCLEPGYTVEVMREFENARPCLAGVGGRLIEMFIETPADRWRAHHLHQGWYPKRIYFCADRRQDAGDPSSMPYFFINGCNNVYRRDAVLAVGAHDEKYRTNAEDYTLGKKLCAHGFDLAFTRAAVSYHRRVDTNASVVRTQWNYGFWAREEAGYYSNANKLLEMLPSGMSLARGALRKDLEANETEYMFLDFLLMMQFPLLDLGYGARHGFFTSAQTAHIQWLVLEQLKRLDRRLGGNLYARVLAESDYLLAAPVPTDDPLTEEMRSPVRNLLEDINADFDALPEWFYEILTR